VTAVPALQPAPVPGDGQDGRGYAIEQHPVGVYLAGKISVTFLVLVVSTIVAVNNPQGTYAPRSAFYVVGVALLVWGASAAAMQREEDLERFGWFQLVFDAVLVTALVTLTSGVESPLVVLYFINIIAAPFLLPWWGTTSVLALDIVGFAAVAFFGREGLFPWLSASHSVLRLEDVVLHVFAMALVGMLSVQLSRTMKGIIARETRRGEELEAERALILSDLDVGTLDLDRSGLVVAANAVAETMLGDVRDRPLSEVLPGEGDTWEVEVEEDDERDTAFLMCTRRPKLAGGELVLVQDVTRLRRMEQAVERDERLAGVGRLAAGLAHEIRNPLASLSGAIQLLQDEAPGPLHSIALREVQRLDQLVDEFLDTAREPRLELQDTDVVALVDDIVTAFGNDQRYADRIVVDVVAPDALPLVPMDSGRVRQVLWNLLLNAAQSMPDRGGITLTLRAHSETLEIRVEDTGVGMAPEKLRRIFDPFFTTRSGGTGLGLANVDRIVRGHGGSVSVYSKAGQGSSFMLSFPLAQRDVDRSRDARRDDPGSAEVIEVDG